MKLIRFVAGDSAKPVFGVVIGDRAVALAVLQEKTGKLQPELADSGTYLSNLPQSGQTAKELLAWGEKDFVFDLHFLRKWKSIFPQAEVLSYPDCGHYIFEDAGQPLTRAVGDFLDRNVHGPEAD